MRFMMLAAFILLPYPAVAMPLENPSSSSTSKAKSDCRSGPSVAVAPRKIDGMMQRLGDAPPAAQIQTVYREVAGCPTPVVLRDGIGANGGQDRRSISGDAQMLPAR